MTEAAAPESGLTGGATFLACLAAVIELRPDRMPPPADGRIRCRAGRYRRGPAGSFLALRGWPIWSGSPALGRGLRAWSPRLIRAGDWITVAERAGEDR